MQMKKQNQEKHNFFLFDTLNNLQVRADWLPKFNTGQGEYVESVIDQLVTTLHNQWQLSDGALRYTIGVLRYLLAMEQTYIRYIVWE